MATTLVAAAIRENVAVIANVGDSRAYSLVDGKLEQISRDDSWVTDAVESGEFTLEDAEKHPWRNVVTKVVGMPDGIEPAIHQVRLSPGDAVLLATDGLFKMLTDDEVTRILLAANDANSATAALVDAANAAGGMDNIGVALYRA
jgi:protein phosphatase